MRAGTTCVGLLRNLGGVSGWSAVTGAGGKAGFRAGLLREFIFADMAPEAKERALKIIAEFRKKD